MDLNYKLYHEDAFKVLPIISRKSVDLIFTDPPYQKSLSQLNPALDGSKIDWSELAQQIHRILRPNGQVAMFCDLLTSAVLIHSMEPWFRLRYHWIWEKPNGSPVNRKQPLLTTELILVFCTKSAKTRDLEFNYEDIMTSGEAYRRQSKYQSKSRKEHGFYETVNPTGKRFPRQVIYFPSKCNMPRAERTAHPTQKPIALCAYVIKALSNVGDTILDPFAGSFSIALACHKFRRQCISIEKDPEYYKMGSERFKKATQQEVLL